MITLLILIINFHCKVTEYRAYCSRKINFMRLRALHIFFMICFAATGAASATTYNLPENPGDNIVTQYPDNAAFIRVKQDETLLDVALRFSLGQEEIVRLNQKVDRWLVKKGEIVRLANRRILPDTPRKGITLNLSEFRIYYYPPGMPDQVMSYATGIGRQDWRTPLGKHKVSKKVKNPSWYPPESIRREHARNGDPLPHVVPPGPHNPLGAYALYLNLRGYLIHGTDIDRIYGIGMQITHGCVRMYPNDIEHLYYMVAVGTPVYIVKQPIKAGWLDGKLYIEAHPGLDGEEMTFDQRYAIALRLIKKATNEETPAFDQEALNQALQTLDGEPVPILRKAPDY
jgi:L,D-transpeptidase ErfK/SrfK